MRKVVALAALAALAAPAHALELKNIRSAYGVLSAPRESRKFLPGDIVTVVFDIEGLKVNEKDGVADLNQVIEIYGEDKFIRGNRQAIKVPLFGATTMPGVVQAFMTADNKPGMYKLKVAVEDKIAKATKKLEFDFELLKPAFGIVQPFTPAVAFRDQDFVINFAVTGMKRDKQSKLPDVQVVMRLLRKNGKPLVQTPVKNNIVEWHVEGTNYDLTKIPVAPVSLPLVLSQKGEFLIEIVATDQLAKKTDSMRLPLTVLDPSPYLSKTEVRPAK